MNKEQFLAALRHRLRYLPAEEVERSLTFYAESVDDRVEDGMSEWEAVAALGDVEAIAREIETSLPLATVVKERVKQEKNKTSGDSKWLWVLLIVLGGLGFFVWSASRMVCVFSSYSRVGDKLRFT